MKPYRHRSRERGTILLVVVFIATAIAGLAAITSSRAVSAAKAQRTLEQETRAFKSAYAQIHVAMNVVNTSAYDDQTHNLALRGAIAGDFGGTIADVVETGQEALRTLNGTLDSGYDTGADWLDHATDPLYGLIEGTNVRVYRGREYIKRLQRLKGETPTDVDLDGDSDAYFVLEAAGRSGDTVRLVSALVRESEPFSAFVFFQNRATLGVSGAPRGLIHSNEAIDFYFPDGNYVDTVSAVDGFGYQAGATTENTNVRDGNPDATPIALEEVDFAELKTKADLYVGEAGLDAEIRMYGDGRIRIRPHTPPRYEMVEKSSTYQQIVGYEDVTVIEQQQVQVGETEVAYEEQVQVGTVTETYTVTESVQVGETTETRTRDVQVQVGTEQVLHTREEPIYEEQVVTKYRWVQVWVSYSDDGSGGGTAVGGGSTGEAGEWQWVQEPYEATEMVQVGTETVEYYVEEPVYETVTETYEVTIPIYEDQIVERTREVPVYETVTQYRTEPVYELQDVEVTRSEPVYETVTYTWMEEEFIEPVWHDEQWVELGEGNAGTIFIDGRVTGLEGDLQGRLTLVGNESVRVSGSIRYKDPSGETAMLNGDTYTEPYVRNEAYTGKSVLGVIARNDVLFTHRMPSSAEINGTLMAVHGRVGIDGFWADDTGELHKDSWSNRRTYLTEAEYDKERAYDRRWSWRTRTFTKDSLRRIGGLISNDRVLETYIRQRSDGTASVDAGFKRGNMRYDINLLFNPPPNFVEVPRPVVTAFVPVFLVRNDDA